MSENANLPATLLDDRSIFYCQSHVTVTGFSLCNQNIKVCIWSGPDMIFRKVNVVLRIELTNMEIYIYILATSKLSISLL